MFLRNALLPARAGSLYREGAMKRVLLAVIALVVCGAAKLPVEHHILVARESRAPLSIPFDLAVGERIGQIGFVAAFGGLRSVAADFLFIQAHVAWEQTEWSRVLLLFRQVTTLQPRSILFWDMAAWHMAWN